MLSLARIRPVAASALVVVVMLAIAGCRESSLSDADQPTGSLISASGDVCPLCPASKSPDAEASEDAAYVAASAEAAETAVAQAVLPGGWQPGDWPTWRGPEQNGVSRETGLPDDLDPQGEYLKWAREDLYVRSTPVSMGGRIYVLTRHEPGQRTEREKIICLDAATGETVWEHPFNVYLSDVPDTRLGWASPACDPETGYVYVLGSSGHFLCLEGASGEIVWERSLHEELGYLSTYGGRTSDPVVFEDLVIANGVTIGWGATALPTHRVIAMNKRTGETVWINGTTKLPDDTTYSVPVFTVLGGQAAMILGSGDGGVWAFQPRTGKAIWQYRFSRRGVNTSVVVVDGRVYMGHSEENVTGTRMGAVAAVDGIGEGDITETNQLWKIEEMMVGKSSPLYDRGRLYLLEDSARLQILDAATGEEVFPRKSLGTIMRSSPLLADGKLYVLEANGRWYVFRMMENGDVESLSRGRLPGRAECLGSPIVSHGRIYVPTTVGLFCFEDASKQHGAAPLPQPPAEAPADEDPNPAQVQIIPADAIVYPGHSLKLTVNLFNARGQLVRQADPREVLFEVFGAGTVDASGAFSTPPDAGHAAAEITARVGGLAGTARVRIVPPLPWQFDFEDVPLDLERGGGEPPITWIGARYRHVVRHVDGSQVMVKRTDIPKGGRSRAWMGHSEMNNYTITADVMSEVKEDGQKADIGLIAQRYVLDLMGSLDKLQIRTWDAEPRIGSSIDFPYEAGRWYRMKFRAEVADGKAVLRGKVWPREEAEPAEWTIEAVDEIPNVIGSPGLYGDARLAEIYYDRIEVVANE